MLVLSKMSISIDISIKTGIFYIIIQIGDFIYYLKKYFFTKKELIFIKSTPHLHILKNMLTQVQFLKGHFNFYDNLFYTTNHNILTT